jgi:hypothetical protein
MSRTEIQITTLTATADDGALFTAQRGPLGRHQKDGWTITGGAYGNWPSVVGIDVDQAKHLLADCVEAHDRWSAATSTANEVMDERIESIRSYFRGVNA